MPGRRLGSVTVTPREACRAHCAPRNTTELASVQSVYVAMGDSAAVGFGVGREEGYVARLHARMRAEDAEARLVNLAQNGATSEDVRKDQVERALREAPSICSIFVGGNDLFRGVEPRRFARNLDAIANRIDLVRTKVVIGTLPNLAHAPAAKLAARFLGISGAQIQTRIDGFNQGVRRVAMDHGYVLVELFDTDLADRPSYFSADGFHPSAEGHAAWCERVWPGFSAALAG